MRRTSRLGSRKPRRPTARLRLEQLEDRALPAFAFASALRLGGTDSDCGYEIKSESAGNVYVTGRFQGTAQFDATHSLTAATTHDTFVAKYDSAGALEWVTDVGPNSRPGSNIAVHDTGAASGADAVYVARSGAVWNGSTLVSGGDLNVARLDPATGAVVWGVQLTSPTASPAIRSEDVAVGSSGSVYVCGTDYTSGAPQAVMARVNPVNGAPVWSVSTSAAVNGSWAIPTGLTVDDSETYVYHTGNFRGTVDFDPDSASTANLTSVNYTIGNGANRTTVSTDDGYVRKLTTGGAFVWAGGLGGAGQENSFGLALDRSGAINVSGNWITTGAPSSTGDFDPGPGVVALNNQGSYDTFLVHLVATNGGYSYTAQISAGGWTKNIGGPLLDGDGHIAVDDVGNIYCNVDSDVAGGRRNIIVSKFSPSGATLSTATIAANSGSQAVGIHVDAGGTVYATGKFYGTADFDPTAGTYNLTSAGQEDAYVLKLTQFTPPPPQITIGDVTATEGRIGTKLFVFTVSLSWASDDSVTLSYATANGTATAGSDYQAQSGTLTFAPGETSKTIAIVVNGDKSKEANETFFVNLSGAFGGTIFDGQGQGTILNDD